MSPIYTRLSEEAENLASQAAYDRMQFQEGVIKDAIVQAIQSGDFLMQVCDRGNGSLSSNCVYMPYRGVEELREEVSRLRGILDQHGISHKQEYAP